MEILMPEDVFLENGLVEGDSRKSLWKMALVEMFLVSNVFSGKFLCNSFCDKKFSLKQMCPQIYGCTNRNFLCKPLCPPKFSVRSTMFMQHPLVAINEL